jgi:hypothetical protein
LSGIGGSKGCTLDPQTPSCLLVKIDKEQEGKIPEDPAFGTGSWPILTLSQVAFEMDQRKEESLTISFENWPSPGT